MRKIDEEKTILSLEMNGNKHITELSWDAGIDELVHSFYGACISATFSPRSVLEYMKEFAEENLDAYWSKDE